MEAGRNSANVWVATFLLLFGCVSNVITLEIIVKCVRTKRYPQTQTHKSSVLERKEKEKKGTKDENREKPNFPQLE